MEGTFWVLVLRIGGGVLPGRVVGGFPWNFVFSNRGVDRCRHRGSGGGASGSGALVDTREQEVGAVTPATWLDY